MNLKCKNCDKELGYNQFKFCSRSCAASYNNRKIGRRHGKAPVHKSCIVCNKSTTNDKFCSKKCFGEHYKKYDTEERTLRKKLLNRESAARYYAKKVYQTPHDEDLTKVREFYLNCPEGYEVDHIIPISKGGEHSLKNLQYLTISENRRKSNKLNW
tara:strand:+ start:95 stop:562 length:468 start_codon:yes stop_codon:yes gene_type:complete